MRVELHILQNFPPANLNRDDTGSPKDCEFGGERRARVSSQCIKRSVRMHPSFAETLGQAIGVRTKRAAEHIEKRLAGSHGLEDDHARILARAALGTLLSDVDADGKTSVLFYAAPAELDELADRLATAYHDGLRAQVEAAASAPTEPADDAPAEEEAKPKKRGKKESGDPLKAALKGVVDDFVRFARGQARAVDVALFGRMLAERPELNLEAACQVAHAISTNRLAMEFDYFTAVDDLNPGEETGAGMIGSTGFNASCFYRYAVVDVDALARRLSGVSDDEPPSKAGLDLARDGVRAFLEASVRAIPTGKQNSTAPQARPDFVMTVVRDGQDAPMSLVNAFEKPVAPSNGLGLVGASVDALDGYWQRLTAMYDDAPVAIHLASTHADTLKTLKEYNRGSVKQVIEATLKALDGTAVDSGAEEAR